MFQCLAVECCKMLNFVEWNADGIMLSLLHKLQSDFYLLYLYLCVRAPTRACMCVCWVLICVVTFKTFLLILTRTIINNDVCKVHVLDGEECFYISNCSQIKCWNVSIQSYFCHGEMQKEVFTSQSHRSRLCIRVDICQQVILNVVWWCLIFINFHHIYNIINIALIKESACHI